MKTSNTIYKIVEKIFFWNSNSAKGLILLFGVLISCWVMYNDHVTGCAISNSFLEQFGNTIAREISLNNKLVAAENFNAYRLKLKSVGIEENLFLVETNELSTVSPLQQPACTASILKSKVEFPLYFGGRTTSKVSGSNHYLPSLKMLMSFWILLLFFLSFGSQAERKIKKYIKINLLEPIELLASGQPISDSGKNLPTEVQKISELLESLKIKIQNEEKTLGEIAFSKKISLIASQVAHDIRSPLSTLTLVASTLSDTSTEKISLIQNSVFRIQEIAKGLLRHKIHLAPTSVLSITDEKIIPMLDIRPVNIEELVLDLVSEKQVSLPKEIVLNTDIKENTETKIMGDRLELSRAISNLLNNSLEAIDNVNGKITIGVRSYKNKSCIYIKDNGRGIPESKLPELGQLGISHNKESGNGLGLFHAKTCILQMAGRLEIKSKEGVGTIVEIELPNQIT